MGYPWKEIGYHETKRAERGEAAPAGSAGAPPSNRAPDTCITDDSFQVLWHGIDSLELSFPGSTNPEVESSLRRLKEQAKSRDPSEKAGAQYVALNHVFRVSDKGWQFYSFILDNNCFRIYLASCHASRIPMALCQIRSEYLVHKGVEAAVAELRVVLTELGLLDGPEKVSRVDMAVDFVTDVNISDWGPSGWITRTDDACSYWNKLLFTGWAVGFGTPTAFRLYLKSHEIDTKSHKVYMHELWRAANWPPGYPVWRAEVQIRRETLRELGIGGFSDLIQHLPGLWAYLTGQWLRYAIVVKGDSTRSRWPTHPLWCSLAAVSWEGEPSALTREHKRSGVPSDEYFGRMGTSLLTSIMARSGTLEPDKGVQLLYEQVKEHCNRRAVMLGLNREDVQLDKVREKGRQYFTMNNTVERELTPDELYWAARAYQRESDGE